MKRSFWMKMHIPELTTARVWTVALVPFKPFRRLKVPNQKQRVKAYKNWKYTRKPLR